LIAQVVCSDSHGDIDRVFWFGEEILSPSVIDRGVLDSKGSSVVRGESLEREVYILLKT